MDPRLKSIIDNFDAMKIGLDDTFHFGCRQCGKCCINREDILLNAKDVYNLCNALSLTPDKSWNNTAKSISPRLKLPIVRLKPQGSIKRCPLLKDRKCSVHNLKPAVCAMYPIGRAIRIDTCEAGSKDLQTLTPVYLYNKTACGDASESHTVREWLTMFGIPVMILASAHGIGQFSTFPNSFAKLRKSFQGIQ